MPRIYKDGVLYNTSPSTASQLPYDNNTSTKDKIDSKMDKANPTGTGSFSLNRLADSIIGTNSFAEGENCTASGGYSHAEGINTISSSGATHAEGSGTKASGSFSHAEGYCTEANHRSQHVFGENNIPDNSGQRNIYRGNYVEIVGNGANSESKSNARTLDWNGNEVLAGGLSINGNQPVAPKSDLAGPSITGSTNNTGFTIEKNQFFYLNGTLVRATTDIANGATLTSGTNYTVVSSGAVNWVSYEYQCPLSTSTTSFQSIDPYSKTTTLYIGGVLDLLHTNINNYTDGAVSNIYLARGGPAYGITLMKVNNNYFSGMIWGYHDSTWNTVWLFSYKAGTYTLRPMAYKL